MLISIPLVQNGTAVVYPGDATKWTATNVVGQSVVGEYAGALYLADGVTKAFNWTAWSPPAPSYGLVITPLAMLNRFLPAEENAIRSAQTSSTQIQSLMDRIHLASFIDLTDPNTEGAINALVTAGLLTAARAATMLTTPAAWGELPASIQAQIGSP
ncbi:MAG: hypothetical protein KGL35_17000 [Bradyrhizobium sp.]|nr:hypothetical protein [Bradyrhizobium sp.]